MKSILMTLAILFSVSQGQATSVHPCAPTVRALPSEMTCRDSEHIYSIIIERLVSPNLEMCSGSNHIEYKTAMISVRKMEADQTPVGEIQILDDHFNYQLGMPGMSSGRFTSEAFGLDLKECISPAQGGFSIGN